jgi:hypothetical protein
VWHFCVNAARRVSFYLLLSLREQHFYLKIVRVLTDYKGQYFFSVTGLYLSQGVLLIWFSVTGLYLSQGLLLIWARIVIISAHTYERK